MTSALFDIADEVIDRVDLSRFAGARILITGAQGFLGTHFVHTFLRLNDRGLLSAPVHVTAMDSQILDPVSWNFDPATRKDLRLLRQSVCDPLPKERWHYILHGASIASPTFYRQFPIETIDANVMGLRSLLAHALEQKSDLQGLLYFSSSEVYGDPDPAYIPLKEDYWGRVSFTGPRACYDESKRLGETMCLAFHRIHGLPVKIARPFNNYGPGMKLDDRRVIPDFCRDLLAGRDLTLLSDGTTRRTYCFVSDAMTGYFQLLLSHHDGLPFNIGNDGPEISVRELAERMITATGAHARVRFAQSEDAHYLTDNPQRRCPDIERARTLLGYRPRVSLEEGLLRTYLSFKHVRGPELSL